MSLRSALDRSNPVASRRPAPPTPSLPRSALVAAFVGVILLGGGSLAIVAYETRVPKLRVTGGAAVTGTVVDAGPPSPSPIAAAAPAAPVATSTVAVASSSAVALPRPAPDPDPPVTLPDGRGAAVAAIPDPEERAEAIGAIQQRHMTSMMDALNRRAARVARR